MPSPRRLLRMPPGLLHGAMAAILSVVTVAIVLQATGRPLVTAIADHLGIGRTAVTSLSCRAGAQQIPRRRVLVLYDASGSYDAYADVSAVLAANLASHYARPVRRPVTSYRSGEMAHYAAVIFVGTSYAQRLPAPFLTDVRSGLRRVLWLGGSTAALTDAAFARSHGWRSGPARVGRFERLRYRGANLTMAGNGLAGITVLDPAEAKVLATAVAAGGRTAPWAVRSGNLTYVAETPLSSTTGTDRSYAVADLLAGLFGPVRPRHLAMIELQGVGPQSDPARLLQVADLLAARGILFSVAIRPEYVFPAARGRGQRISLAERPAVVGAIEYMLARGGTEILQGYTGQPGTAPGGDARRSTGGYEFLRVRYDSRHVPVYASPAGGDPAGWARQRIRQSLAAISAAGLPRPALWQFPGGAATPAEYHVAASQFAARYGPVSYAAGSAGRGDLRTLTDQDPPYLVRDAYGGPVLPQTLGSVAGPRIPAAGPGSVQAMLTAAAAQKAAVRENVASADYDAYLGTGPLRRLVAGLASEHYSFVGACAVLKGEA